ncbi:hypothetical protein LUZ63_019950 [Rhynchospora breviuscula]|uniref:DUF641 domain-containing protein n=1 Tax=Rhynchospora breviuscula TaxID=2022672 RepID=A0A9Q0HK85_9POAL|nr:hypothetical protein LUZ63_019950 [Rhynchospora breviuscula]
MGSKRQEKEKAATTVATVADLLHRVASSCLSQRLPGTRTFDDDDDQWSSGSSVNEHEESRREAEEESIARAIAREKNQEEEEEEEEEERLRIWEQEDKDQSQLAPPPAAAAASKDQDQLQLQLMESLLAHVFDGVSAVKRAYRTLQQSHCPWDPHKIHSADASVVSELRKLDTLRHRFRRTRTRAHTTGASPGPMLPSPSPSLSDAVAPYEAALDDLKKELKVKDAELENLRQKLGHSDLLGATVSRKGRSHSARWATFSKRLGSVQGTAIPQLFEVSMLQMKSASKSFTSHLLALMRAARWDIPATMQSLIPGASVSSASNLPPQHAKFALESYVNSRLFQGFEHESFYLDGSLASLLDPAAFRRSCFSQFRDMRTMDPTEMLGVLPTCQFGLFAATKYQSLVHEKMEESLFGHKEHRQQVIAGTHPRTEFYAEFLLMAKAVWMLHLLAFALDPAPTHFEARKGVEFQPEFMESVVRFASGRVPAGWVVGFAVSPGFRLGNGSVIRARVYLIPRNAGQ